MMSNNHNDVRLRYGVNQGVLRCWKWSVAKCHGSWVVGRGRGSWVWAWVNVVCKKMSSKKEKIKKQKVVKISGYIPVLFPFPAVSKTNYRIL